MATRRRRRRHVGRRRLVMAAALVVAASIAVVLVVRQRAQDPAELLARAQAQLESGAVAGAIIDLKNVVAAESGNREARSLLGHAYMRAGNPAGAIKELTRARELGARDAELDLDIVRALILTGKFDDAASEIALHGDTTQAQWLVLRGMLDLAQQRLEDARAAFTQILARDPDFTEARRGLMQAELAAGNAELARAEVETLLAGAESDPMLWVIKGELDLHDRDPARARDSFQRALDLAAGDPLAHLGMARAQLALGQPDTAGEYLDALGKNGETDPRVNFLRAEIAEKKGDHNSALVNLRKVLQLAPMHRESLVMAARVHFTLGEFTRAQDYVGRLLEIEPNNEGARRMLGAIQLASGRLDGLHAYAGAESGADGVPQDPGTLALLGTAYLRHGKFEDGRKSLERAVELAPDSLPIRTQLALSKLSNGEPDAAIAELEAVLAEDPDFVQADIMLALVLMTQKRDDEALAVARELVGKRPDEALPHNVLGYVMELGGDKDAAAREYESALALDAAFHPARINLARLAIQRGDVAAGREYFQGVIKREPFHPFALLGLAALALQENRIDEAERLWLLAREHNPDAVAPRLLLAKHYRAGNKLVLAETAAAEAYRLAPYAVPVQAEYAAIMLQNGKYQDALKAALDLSARVPDSLAGLELLARVYNQLGDAQGLTATLERIARIAPKAVGAQVLLARLALRRKDYDAAESIATALLRESETTAQGHEVRGDLLEARGDPEGALAAYARAHASTPTSGNVLKLDRLERMLGRAGGRLEAWLAQHPDDLQVRLVHASYLQQEGAGGDAIAQYEKLLAAQGENPIVLNNLAWLYHEIGDARALDLARRAFELAPSQAEIMDTYGWILFARGQREQGLELLERAAGIAPGNPDITYHVASALLDSGHEQRARDTLERVLAEHAAFMLRKEAEALLAKMRQ